MPQLQHLCDWPGERYAVYYEMIRKLSIAGLSVTSALLAVLWIASYWWWPAYWTKRPSPNIEVTCLPGHWIVDFAPDAPPDLVNNITLEDGKLHYYRRVVINDKLSQPAESSTRHELFGYVLAYGVKPRRLGPLPPPLTTILVVHIPIAPILLIAAAYPIIAFVRGPLRRHHRKRRNLCRNCGYNLTGNVSGNCSECGTRI